MKNPSPEQRNPDQHTEPSLLQRAGYSHRYLICPIKPHLKFYLTFYLMFYFFVYQYCSSEPLHSIRNFDIFRLRKPRLCHIRINLLYTFIQLTYPFKFSHDPRNSLISGKAGVGNIIRRHNVWESARAFDFQPIIVHADFDELPRRCIITVNDGINDALNPRELRIFRSLNKG